MNKMPLDQKSPVHHILESRGTALDIIPMADNISRPGLSAMACLVPFHDSSVGRVMDPGDTGYQNFTSE